MRALGIVLVALAAILVIALIIWCSPRVARGFVKGWNWAATRRRRKADREVPWAPYSRLGDSENSMHVGVERVTEDGRVLSRVLMCSVPVDDEAERLTWESLAKVRAESYNESRVGM